MIRTTQNYAEMTLRLPETMQFIIVLHLIEDTYLDLAIVLFGSNEFINLAPSVVK